MKLYFDSFGLGHLMPVAQAQTSGRGARSGESGCCLGAKTFTLCLRKRFTNMSRQFLLKLFMLCEKEASSIHS